VRRREFIKLLGGATAAWPFSVRAQQSAKPLIGFMSARSPDDTGPVLQAFLKGLGEFGFFDGHNVVIEYRWARGEYDRLPAFAADLVQRRVNVLVATGGNSSAIAAKHATSTIPIVFVAGDPVRIGLVQNINRPGGNIDRFCNTHHRNGLEAAQLVARTRANRPAYRRPSKSEFAGSGKSIACARAGRADHRSAPSYSESQQRRGIKRGLHASPPAGDRGLARRRRCIYRYAA